MINQLFFQAPAINNLIAFKSYVKGYSTVSFDLFDTLIYRKNLTRWEIQELVAEYAVGTLSRFDALSVSSATFMTLRQDTTQKIKAGYFGRATSEPTLEEILIIVLKQLSVSNDSIESLALEIIEFELSLEISSLRAMDGAIELLEFLLAQKKQLIIITDMYLSRLHIDRILQGLGLAKYFDQIFVSSEFGATKHDGSLYVAVESSKMVELDSVVHIGDNYKSDVKSALKHKFKAVYFNQKALKRPPIQARKNLSIDHKLAYLVTSFLLRMAFRCKAIGIKRLYFLSRDATVLGRIMLYGVEKNSLLKEIMQGVEVKFLSLNRYTTLYLDVDFKQEAISQILSKSIKLFPNGYTLIELFQRLSVQLDGLDLDVLGLKLDDKVNFQKISAQLLFNSPLHCERLIKAVQDHNEIVSNYLIQESVLETGDALAMVDIGYEGSIVKAVSKYSKLKNIMPLDLYMVLFCTSSYLARKTSLDGKPAKFDLVAIDQDQLSYLQSLNYSWLEFFFQDRLRGPLIGYETINGVVTPQYLSKQVNVVTNNWELICRELLRAEEGIELFMPKECLNVSAKSFLNGMNRPSQAILERLGDAHYARGLLDEGHSNIVRDDLSFKKIADWRNLKALISNEVWIVGSLYASKLTWIYPIFEGLARGYFLLKRWYK